MRAFRWMILALLACGAGVALLARSGAIALPDRYDPWAPLDIQAEPNLLTRLKLGRLDGDGRQCRTVLGNTGLRFTPVPDLPSPEDDCTLRDTVRVARSQVGFNSGFTATCQLAAAWMLFELHALQPAALRQFGQRVARVRHLGTFACRNVYGRADGRRSEHATANAIDIAGFTLEDGTSLTVAGDWGPQESGRRAAFLREVRDGACRFFAVVLGPEHNRAHRDHFHLDLGSHRACR